MTNVYLQFTPYYVPNATQVDYNAFGVDVISGAHQDDILKVYSSPDGNTWTYFGEADYTNTCDDASSTPCVEFPFQIAEIVPLFRDIVLWNFPLNHFAVLEQQRLKMFLIY